MLWRQCCELGYVPKFADMGLSTVPFRDSIADQPVRELFSLCFVKGGIKAKLFIDAFAFYPLFEEGVFKCIVI